MEVPTKEQADHSLPYVIAVALLDGEVTPAQYAPKRILQDDVQALLRKVTVRPADEYSASFPEELPCHVTIHLGDGQILRKEMRTYPGFTKSPLPWNAVEDKFHRLAEPSADHFLRDAIVSAVANLDQIRISELTRLFDQVGGVADIPKAV